ncbi:MAG TPA: DUF624 domain-containing protein [Flexilinea sp.]|nr:DUF624 domain-containing protein [Flexilinea sp.]
MTKKSRKTKPDFSLPQSGWKRTSILYTENFFELIKLSLIFILFSLPIFTVFASITAMNYVISKIINDRLVFIWDDFLKAFKSNFLRSTLYGILSSVIFVLLMLGWNISNQITALPSLIQVILKVFYIFIGIVLILHTIYFYSIQAWIDLPFRSVLRNAILIQFVAYKTTLKIFLILIVVIPFIWIFRPITYFLIPFFSATIVFLINSYAMQPIQKYLIIKKPEEDPAFNDSNDIHINI